MEEKQKKVKQTRHRQILFLAAFFAVGVFFLIKTSSAEAANLYFSPSSGSHEVGTSFTVNVYVSSADQAMNAALCVISFPQDKLEVISLSKTGSIFVLWVQEPSYSNAAGTASFEGIVLNPGFTGASGKILSITFRVKAAGIAPIEFLSGSILANDGQGTNILTSLGSAQFSLGNVAPTVTETAETKATTPPTSGVPAAPQIFSSTHPDFNKWYNNKNPQFSWTLPSNVNGVSIYLSASPTSNPGSVSDGLFNSKSYNNVDDGIWYFHIRMKTAVGWGPITHFKLHIDTQPPEPFIIKFIDGKETENPRPTVVFDTYDSLSSVDYYKIKIGEGDFFQETPETVKNNPYTLPLQSPGKRNILVQAFDKAGNYAVATEEFVIKPLAAPIITEYPKELVSDEILTVKGTTYPNAQVVIWLQREKDNPKNFTVQIDQDGKFTFTADEKLRDGIYQLWAEVIDMRGARSKPTEKTTIVVEQPTILKIGTQAVTILTIVVPLVALIILLLALIWYGWHKFLSFRKKIRKEAKEAEQALRRAIKLLKENIGDQIKLLEKTKSKRQLTEEEDKIIKQLRKDLDDTEKFVGKEIEDIEKVVK